MARRVEATFLPVGPLREAIGRWVVLHNLERGLPADAPPAQGSQFAAQLPLSGWRVLASACHGLSPDRSAESWERQLRRIRFEVPSVPLGTADVIVTAMDDGTRLDDLWPDWAAASAEGYRLRMGRRLVRKEAS